MAIIPVPAALRFSKVNSFTLQRATNILRSKYTGQAQRISYPYAVWELEATLLESVGIEAGQLRSFLAQLEGQKNSFRLPVPGYRRPTTGYQGEGGTNLASAARSSSISVDTSAANRAILADGDYFTIQDELKIVTAAVASNASSTAVISFKPALRKPVAAGVGVYMQNPWVLMTAQDDDVAKWSIGPPVRQSSNFNAIEALDI